MGDTILNSYPIGGGKIIPVDHTGPASYPTGGETLGTTNNMTGISVVGLGSLDMVLGSGSMTESGTYWVYVLQSGTGSRKTFQLLWFMPVAGSGTFTGTPAVLTGTNICSDDHDCDGRSGYRTYWGGRPERWPRLPEQAASRAYRLQF